MKLIKLSKLKYSIAKIEDKFTNKKLLATVLILKLQIYLFILAHLFGCLMYTISKDDLSPNTFANEIINNSGEFVTDLGGVYLSCIYWAYTTMVSIGYGDISPQTSNEKIFGILCMLMSCVTFGIILGNIASIVEKNSLAEKKRRELFFSLNKFFKIHNIDTKLRQKVKRFIEYTFESSKNEEIELNDLLELLSEPLREEIYCHLNGKELFTFPLFTNFSIIFANKLSKIMHGVVYAPNDDILIENTPAVGLFFIQTGMVEIYDKKSKAKIKSLETGDYFGEVGLFTRNPCCSSVLSRDYTEVIVLFCEDFDKVLEFLPSAKKTFIEIKEKALNDDLSILGVKCYLCDTVGHVAKYCNFIEVIRKDNKTLWLQRNSKTKNFRFKNEKMYKHMRKTKNFKHYSIQNVKGVRTRAEKVYNNRLAKVVKRFMIPTNDEDELESNHSKLKSASVLFIPNKTKNSLINQILSDSDFCDDTYLEDLI